MKRKEKSGDGSWCQVCKMLLKYRKLFIGIILCLLCTSIITFFQPMIIRQITDQGMVQKDLQCILFFSGIMVLVSFIQQGVGVIQTRIFSNLHNIMISSLYEKSYWKLKKLSIQYFDEKGSVEITNTINADINNVASIANQITTFSVSSVLQIIGGIVGLALLDWKLALLIVLIIPIKFIIVYFFSEKKNEKVEQWIESNRMFTKWLGDCVSGIREMKLWNLFDVKRKEFEELQKKMMDSYKENIMLDEYRTLSIALLDAVLNASLYMLGGMLIVKRELTIGEAFAFITYSGYVVSPISFLINIKYYFAKIRPSAKRLITFWRQPEEPGIEYKIKSEDFVKASQVNKAPVIELKNVSFGYKETELVLKDVSFSVQRGEKVAIIGENGSGKSTILNLLTGFYQPQKGVIKVNELPLETMNLEKIRNNIAVISQKPYLFQGTIDDNINIDGKASCEQIWNACKKSGALNFINKLEQGLKQEIGQNGAMLSGGERQKIAVARALLKNSEILLMDEATTGFDVESNKAIHNLLYKELEGITVIFVTHKYEELEVVDRVYKLSEGVLKRYKG